MIILEKNKTYFFRNRNVKMTDLLSPQQFATKTGLPISRVRRLIREGKLEYVPIGKRRFLEPKAYSRMIENLRISPNS